MNGVNQHACGGEECHVGTPEGDGTDELLVCLARRNCDGLYSVSIVISPLHLKYTRPVPRDM